MSLPARSSPELIDGSAVRAAVNELRVLQHRVGQNEIDELALIVGGVRALHLWLTASMRLEDHDVDLQALEPCDELVVQRLVLQEMMEDVECEHDFPMVAAQRLFVRHLEEVAGDDLEALVFGDPDLVGGASDQRLVLHGVALVAELLETMAEVAEVGADVEQEAPAPRHGVTRRLEAVVAAVRRRNVLQIGMQGILIEMLRASGRTSAFRQRPHEVAKLHPLRMPDADLDRHSLQSQRLRYAQGICSVV